MANVDLRQIDELLTRVSDVFFREKIKSGVSTEEAGSGKNRWFYLPRMRHIVDQKTRPPVLSAERRGTC